MYNLSEQPFAVLSLIIKIFFPYTRCFLFSYYWMVAPSSSEDNTFSTSSSKCNKAI